jgi:hypothetical protein
VALRGGQCTGDAMWIAVGYTEDSHVEEHVRFAERVHATYFLQNDSSFVLILSAPSSGACVPGPMPPMVPPRQAAWSLCGCRMWK